MKNLIWVGTLLFLFSSCLKHKTIAPVTPTATDTTSTCTDTILFNAELMTEIFTPSCNTAGCHNAVDAASSYDFTNHANVSSAADLILKTLNHENGVTAMPLGAAKIEDSLIQKFDCWINQGKLDN